MKIFLSMDAQRLSRFLWGAVLVALPVTSFRWFPFLGESTLVRPLALYPLVLLLPLLLIQAYRKKIDLYWPGVFVPLGLLILFILTAASLGLVFDPIPLRGQTYLGRALRAMATLCIGLSFFLGAVWMNRNEEDLRFSVRWILAGLCLDIVWSGLQAVTFYTKLLDKEMVTNWQLAFSMRELVRSKRISGLAFEPAWLAGQFATIFIPFLFAGLLTNYRILRRRWLEPALLALSLLVLLGTYSRGGILITAGVAGLVALIVGRDSLRAMWIWFMSGFRSRVRDTVLRIGLVLALVGGMAGALLFLAQKDYFSNLWNLNADSLNEYIVSINAGARGAYSAGALAAFEEYPWTGVGLGASGFHIYENLPEWSLTFLPEISKQLDPSSRLYPNPKNLYVRLLAETGLIGFFLFLAFQFHLLGDVLSLWRRQEAWARYALTAGVFSWLAVFLYNFTQDSLATPNIWLVSGLLVGISAVRPLTADQTV